MTMSEFLEHLGRLSSAEDFLTFLEVPFDPKVLAVNRLHILKRFHDYLDQAAYPAGAPDGALKDAYRSLLERAYADFLQSDARKEKVFKVFRDAAGPTGPAFVPIGSIRRSGGR